MECRDKGCNWSGVPSSSPDDVDTSKDRFYCGKCGIELFPSEEDKKEVKIKPRPVLKAESVKPKVSKNILDKIKDITKDLMDDGKRNYSHDPERKSPGRHKKRKV